MHSRKPQAIQPRAGRAYKVRLRINAGGGGEAPTAVVAGEITVDELLHEVALAHAPVEQQVFCEEGGDGHAAAVVHVGHVIQLPHCGIDWQTCVSDGLQGKAGLESSREIFRVEHSLNGNPVSPLHHLSK